MEPSITHEVTPDGKTFRCTIVCPKAAITQIGQEEFERQAWNETLSRAHKDLLVPVGSIFIGDPEDVEPDRGEVATRPLGEGLRLQSNAPEAAQRGFMEGFGAPMQIEIPMVRVVCEVSLVQESRGGP